jgi:hypothetical protein
MQRVELNSILFQEQDKRKEVLDGEAKNLGRYGVVLYMMVERWRYPQSHPIPSPWSRLLG